MLVLKKKTASLIAEAISGSFASGLLSEEEIFGMLEYPPDKNMGDLALPCFRLSKALRRSPVEIAKTLSDNVKCEEFSEITALNGYLNFKIDGTNFAKRVIDEVEARGEKYGAPAMGEGKTVVLENITAFNKYLNPSLVSMPESYKIVEYWVPEG
jgi:arginyl-tRNA synthetase